MSQDTLRWLMLTTAVAAAVLLVPTMAGCNTVKGVGIDLHDSAQGVEDIFSNQRARPPQQSSNTRRRDPDYYAR